MLTPFLKKVHAISKQMFVFVIKWLIIRRFKNVHGFIKNKYIVHFIYYIKIVVNLYASNIFICFYKCILQERFSYAYKVEKENVKAVKVPLFGKDTIERECRKPGTCFH